jgi:Cu/Ag efflux pump CusA
MAIVILGGLISSTLVSLLLVPPLAARWLYRA